jgi:hypothetical protein
MSIIAESAPCSLFISTRRAANGASVSYPAGFIHNALDLAIKAHSKYILDD